MNDADRNRRRLFQLGAVIALAVIVVVVAIVISGGDNGTPKKKAGEVAAGQTESREMLAGIPQSGITLGDPKAKVTMIEFADLQCPVCKEYTLQVLPLVVRDYVRTGKVKLELQTLSFLGPDSITAAKFAHGAAKQDKMWNFVDVFYYNQGQENSGYATDQFIRKIASAVPGLDADRAKSDGEASGQQGLGTANTLAQKYAVNATPTLLVAKGGGAPKTLDNFSFDTVKKALDQALAG